MTGAPPSPRSPIAVAMSGGVDSSLAAALLLEQGERVCGITMLLHTGQEAAASARAVCEWLGIPHHVLNLQEPFERHVVAPFCYEYARGRTPNPCVQCNRVLKFGLLLQAARDLGCMRLATGHYARIGWQAGRQRLLCARDARKDQSYFLYTLDEATLAQLVFPLGDYTKDEVRVLARSRGLPTAERPESQDICFIPAGDYRRLVAERLPESVRPGPIVDLRDHELGRHRGLPYYTVGQREGLGIAAPRPLYVLRLDVAHNAVIVGHIEELGWRALEASGVSYVGGDAEACAGPVECKIRHRARRAAAHLTPLADGWARLTFGEPLRDICPGQSAVFYRKDEVLGGGVIERALEPDASEEV